MTININDLTIGQAKELAALLNQQGVVSNTAKPEQVPAFMDDGRYIVVLQRGWVMVGNITKEGDYIKMTNVSNIEYWGTTEGLGQLANSGPTETTRLRRTPDLFVHELTVIFFMQVQDNVI